jgi:hypothetical protein
MAARLTALLPRLLALTVIWLLGAATFTLAAEKKPGVAEQTASTPEAKPEVLVVPDVRGKAYVFAKGILQDTGFAWRVQGAVQGYSANAVIYQTPAPSSRVIDNGAPTVVLRLARNTAYGERGLPENDAPYVGTRVVYLSDWREQREDAVATTTAATTNATTTDEQPEPSEPKTREPDFVVPGAKPEPTDEMSLPQRAQRLQERMASAQRSTRNLVNFWLYQHAWIVTGARFGWHNGAESLRILIRVDQSLERRFHFGARSEAVARSALAYVEAKTK